MLIIIVSLILIFFFFFKQKTAYEMRISDWSSDVCSSDLQVFSIDLSSMSWHSEKTMTCRVWPSIQKLAVYVRLESLTEDDFKVTQTQHGERDRKSVV